MDATESPGTGGAGGTYARLLGAFAALGAGAVAVVLGVLLLRGLPALVSTSATSTAGSAAEATQTTATAPKSTGFPLPPSGAVVYGAEAGTNALGLAVKAGPGKVVLQASVVDIQGKGVHGASVSFGVTGPAGKQLTARATACGAGCYRAAVGIPRPRSVVVHLTGEKPVSFAMPSTWPAPSGARIVELAGAAWRKLHTLAYHDSLGDGKVVLETDWTIVGPDRIEFHEIGLRKMSDPGQLIRKDYGAGIIIGDRRWDRMPGSSVWAPSPQTPVEQPVPFWQSASDARVLGSVIWRGAPAWKVSFFDRAGGPGWFTIMVDKATLHTTELWMTAADHFMHETYTAFDTPIEITPPTAK